MQPKLSSLSENYIFISLYDYSNSCELINYFMRNAIASYKIIIFSFDFYISRSKVKKELKIETFWGNCRTVKKFLKLNEICIFITIGAT